MLASHVRWPGSSRTFEGSAAAAGSMIIGRSVMMNSCQSVSPGVCPAYPTMILGIQTQCANAVCKHTVQKKFAVQLCAPQFVFASCLTFTLYSSPIPFAIFSNPPPLTFSAFGLIFFFNAPSHQRRIGITLLLVV